MADDLGEMMNQARGGWDEAMGLRFVSATRDEVVAEYVVDRRHHQGYGIVHGGMHCGAIETVCSTGAALDAMPRGLGWSGSRTTRASCGPCEPGACA